MSLFNAPPISTTSAHLLTLFFAASYVGSLYISKNARPSYDKNATAPSNGQEREKQNNERWRDDPDVVRARLAAASIATVLSCLVVFALLWSVGGGETHNPLGSTFTRLGFVPSLNVLPHLITPLLFLGPLYSCYLAQELPLQANWSYNHVFAPLFLTWPGLRNYLFAPVTEEIVFRACVLSVYHLSGASRAKMIFLGPLSFGLAHAHHAWDTYNRYGRTALAAKRAIIMCLIQLTYTTLFGFHCSYLFLRTGSVCAPITAHVFCNIMGVPHMGEEMLEFPRRRNAIIIAYTVGIAGFVYTLGPWTATEGNLYWRVANVADGRV